MKKFLIFSFVLVMLAFSASAATIDFKSDSDTQWSNTGNGNDWQNAVSAWIHGYYPIYISIPGTWIWRSNRVTDQEAVEGSTVYFMKDVELPECAREMTGYIDITTDNAFELMLNDQLIGADTNWFTAEHYDLTGKLQAGTNTFTITANNEAMQGGNPDINPAAVIFAGQISYNDSACNEAPEFSGITGLVAVLGAVMGLIVLRKKF
jgi:hypothetical protein